jgi:hypothetical protein
VLIARIIELAFRAPVLELRQRFRPRRLAQFERLDLGQQSFGAAAEDALFDLTGD